MTFRTQLINKVEQLPRRKRERHYAHTKLPQLAWRQAIERDQITQLLGVQRFVHPTKSKRLSVNQLLQLALSSTAPLQSTGMDEYQPRAGGKITALDIDRKSTRLNSSH